MRGKFFDWGTEKSRLLKKTRGVTFEEVVTAVKEGKLITVLENPRQKRYPNQKILVVEIHDYIYAVPCLETEGKIFLKTVFPSRKLTAEYLEKRSQTKNDDKK